MAIVGAVLLFNYVSAADARAQKDLEPVTVLVASRDIPAGTPVEELASSLETRSIPGAAIAPGALSSLADITDKVVASEILAGEQLLDAKLVAESALLTPGAVQVPAGLQEVTILLEPERVAGGNLKAGDKVGVFTNFSVKEKGSEDAEEVKLSKHLYDGVLVTAIQIAPSEQTATPEGTTALPSGSAYVTLGVDSVQATKIVHTQIYGELWLSKQNDDTNPGNRSVIDVNEVLK
ncbi:hypothetical protein NCCP1664_01190 [Zafaria cholistanensis]|uniref:SAF domain-containing protein n=1 Tax=Zafaria cholistanensis TaxID=1682741 RepID=A0A5A7NN42_9MICC|nr:hypothetical protein NCCP1664_01190 [Zafaria cholistanensis]